MLTVQGFARVAVVRCLPRPRARPATRVRYLRPPRRRAFARFGRAGPLPPAWRTGPCVAHSALMRTALMRTALVRTALMRTALVRTALMRTALVRTALMRTATMRTAMRTATMHTATMRTATMRTATMRTARGCPSDVHPCMAVDPRGSPLTAGYHFHHRCLQQCIDSTGHCPICSAPKGSCKVVQQRTRAAS